MLRANARSPHDLGAKEPVSAAVYTPWASTPAARRVMQGNRKGDTGCAGGGQGQAYG